MLWLVLGNTSHEIVGCNIHIEGDTHQVWVTRPANKSLKIYEGTRDGASEVKEAIDFAIESKEAVLRL